MSPIALAGRVDPHFDGRSSAGDSALACPAGDATCLFALPFSVWNIEFSQIADASLKGLVIASTLLYIIFGAILLLETLRSIGALDSIRNVSTTFQRPSDCRCLVIWIVYLPDLVPRPL